MEGRKKAKNGIFNILGPLIHVSIKQKAIRLAKACHGIIILKFNMVVPLINQ